MVICWYCGCDYIGPNCPICGYPPTNDCDDYEVNHEGDSRGESYNE